MTTNLPSQPAGPQITDAEANLELKEIEGLSQGQIVRKRFFRHWGAVTSMIVLALIVILAFTSVGLSFGSVRVPGWWTWDWTQNPRPVNGGVPSLEHPFGQDSIGKDLFALVMRGTQQSLMIMVIVGLIGSTIGIIIGALSGFFRGWVDSVLMRFTDVIITIPFIVIGAVIGSTFGKLGAFILALVLGLFSWTGLARLVRGEFLTLREREFVDAARVAGASNGRIIFKHILPNAMGVIIVNTTLLMAGAILAETGLSYLGYGVQAPDTSLGLIISQNQEAFQTRPWLFWWPGLFIITIALCINFIGDGLRDAFDPRQKRMPSERAMRKADAVIAADAAALRGHEADDTSSATTTLAESPGPDGRPPREAGDTAGDAPVDPDDRR
ncbi:ABC transporter permease [Agrococcus beijingensis]|uniref:ABC transporter permease n=1 Tax=Agrococcus beijingensis TaxID=3068634 RepID=UPI00274078AC|nr:ABC transporter permease [Agrococcus sp. REN33]